MGNSLYLIFLIPQRKIMIKVCPLFLTQKLQKSFFSKICFVMVFSILPLFYIATQFIFPSPVFASENTYYVSPKGNDQNVGSVDLPLQTVSKALSKVAPGDTLILQAGEYKEKITLNKNGTEDQPITVQSAQGEKVILNLENAGSPVLKVSGKYINVNGLEIENSKSACVELTGSNITARNLNVHDCGSHGIYTEGQNINIEDNTVYHTNVENNRISGKGSSSWGSAIKVRVNGDNVTIKGNTVYNNWGEGIAMTRATNSLVTQNTVFDNYGVNIYVDNSHDVKVDRNFSYCTPNSGYERDGQRSIGLAIGEEKYEGWGNQLARVEITNNIVANCSRGLVSYQAQQPDGGLDTISIINNTFWDTTQTALSFNQGTTATKTRNTTIANNIVYQSNRKEVWADNPSGLSFSHNNWSVKPTSYASSMNDIIGKADFMKELTTSPAAFHLDATSPLINKGKQIQTVTVDYDNKLRNSINSPEYDIGALEFSGDPVQAEELPKPPAINSIPYVGTVKLRPGKVNEFYARSITGYDIDVDDTLQLSVSNAPSTITLQDCRRILSFTGKREVLCDFKGTPSESGVYPVVFTVTDNKGASATQKVIMEIQ
jgi:parallel beta-helix repeat protein